MKFEHPGFLYALLLLAIPLIVHLFHFRRYKTLYFSSLQFVRQIDEESKSTRKLKHLLVLISRLLAYIFIVLCFAQPYKPVDSAQGSGLPVMAVYLDNSYSMSRKGSDGELISMACEQARKMINKAGQGTRFMIVTNNLEGFEQQLISKEEALNRLDKIESSPMSRKMDEILNWMQSSVHKEQESGNMGSVQYILLSDFQKKTAHFTELHSDDKAYYYPIQISPQQEGNVSIDSVYFSDPNFKTGINNELQILLTNHSDQDLVNLSLQLEVNETRRDVFVDLKATEQKTIPINYADLKPGVKKGVVRVNDKQMHFDDDYFFSYKVEEKSNVLIVDGEDAVPNIAIVYSLDAYYQLQQVSLGSFTPDKLNQIDLLILNGWNSFNSGTTDALFRYLKDGGSLAVFPGEKPDFEQLNQFTKRINGPHYLAAGSGNTKITSIAYADPFFQGMFDKKPDKLNLPAQSKVFQISGSRSDYNNLINLQNGSPLLLKLARPYNAYFFASSLTDAFGNFKSNALFSSILLRMAETSQRRYPLALTIGSEAFFPVYKVPRNEEPLKLRSSEVEFVPESQNEDDRILIGVRKSSFTSQLRAGHFEMWKGSSLGYMALNFNRNESGTETLNADEITNELAAKGIKNVSYSAFSDAGNASFIEIQKPVTYWRYMLIAGLLFLLVELGLLKWLK